MKQIFDSQTENGSEVVNGVRASNETILVSGTFDGASVIVEVSPNNGDTWFSDEDLTIIQPSVKNLDVASFKGCKYKISITNAGTSTNLTVFFGG